MSEATRLESLVRQPERERFDAREVLRGCVSGYASVVPGIKFALSLPETPVMLRGAPDLYAQMLDTAKAKAGLHPTVATFLAERCVAVLGSDGNNDTAPSTTEGIGFPIHVLAINAMGVHLLDYLQFEDLVRGCEEAGRWEFLFAAAPLRIPRGTGSPLNPTAIF